MGRLLRIISPTNAKHSITALGGLYVTLALGEIILGAHGYKPLVEAVIDVLLYGGPGLGLLYGAFRLSKTNIHPQAYPRIAKWCFAGFGIMLLIVGLLVVNPVGDVDDPIRAGILATALGSVFGFGIGLNEARALTRAYEAEQHEQQLQREKDRLESFAGMLAHELRNPLTIAQIYHQQSKEGDDAAAEQVEKAHERIEEMVDILLIIARKGEANINRETVSIANVADDVWEDIAPDTATLIVEIDRMIQVDPVHFHHLLKNLFSNAIEHGGKDVTVRVGGLNDGFYVEDNGPGIPEEKREVVFEAGHTSKTDGIGLGLTFVGELVQMYDWNCTVSDSEDGGMRFECANVDIASPNQRRVT